jgi:hypothetical protein
MQFSLRNLLFATVVAACLAALARRAPETVIIAFVSGLFSFAAVGSAGALVFVIDRWMPVLQTVGFTVLVMPLLLLGMGAACVSIFALLAAALGPGVGY